MANHDVGYPKRLLLILKRIRDSEDADRNGAHCRERLCDSVAAA